MNPSVPPEPSALADPASAPTRRVRIAGVVVICCGWTIVGIIAVVAWYTLPMMLGMGGGSTTTYSGTPLDTVFVLAIYALVFAVGLSAMVAGYAYYRTGRARFAYRRPMLFFVSLLMLVGIAAKVFLSRG